MGFMVAYIPNYLLSAFMRCLYVLCFSLLGVLRVDYTQLPFGVHTFDTTYITFIAICLRYVEFNSPLYIVAADMLSTSERMCPRKARVRNRFWLALFLTKYPQLQRYRKRDSKSSTDDIKKESSFEMVQI